MYNIPFFFKTKSTTFNELSQDIFFSFQNWVEKGTYIGEKKIKSTYIIFTHKTGEMGLYEKHTPPCFFFSAYQKNGN